MDYEAKAREVVNGACSEDSRPYYTVERIAQALRGAAADAYAAGIVDGAKKSSRPDWGFWDHNRGAWIIRCEVARPDGHRLRQDWLVSQALVEVAAAGPKVTLFDEAMPVLKNVVHMAVDGPPSLRSTAAKGEG